MNTIRRSDAIDALIKEYPYINPTSITDVIMHVEDADPERKTGRWIAHDLSIKDVPTECCSECCEWSYGWHEKYCPKCGAKMEPKQTLSEADNDTAYGGLMSAT